MKVLSIMAIMAMVMAALITFVPETTDAAEPEGPKPLAGEFRVDSDVELALAADSGAGTDMDPWVIENRVIDGFGLNYAMYIGNTTEYLEIRNCTINGTTELHSFWFYVSAGIHLYNTDNVRITNCSINNTQTYAIFVSNVSYNIMIDNCTFWNNTERCISFDGAYIGAILDNNLYCNETTTNGIVFNTYSDNHDIARNYIEHACWCGIVMNDTWNASVYENTIVGNISDMGPDGNISTVFGMVAYNSRWVDFTNNTVTDCKTGVYYTGTTIPYTRDSEIICNNITGCYNVGVHLEEVDTILLSLNTIDNNNGDRGESNIGVFCGAELRNTNITYNTITNYSLGINVTDPMGTLNSFVHNNHFTANTLHAWSEATDALCQFWCQDTGKGNWWDDWTYVHGGDTDRDGIVDTPRDIDGIGAAIDNYPQTVVPTLVVGGGGGSGDPPPYVPPVEVAETDTGWSLNLNLGILFWAGMALLFLGFAKIPIPYTQPIWLKGIGFLLIILNFMW